VATTIAGMNMQTVRTAPRSLWQKQKDAPISRPGHAVVGRADRRDAARSARWVRDCK
jgi:hypothetical protein